MTAWRDLSDGELRARLAQHCPDLDQHEIEHTVYYRDHPDMAPVIAALLDD